MLRLAPTRVSLTAADLDWHVRRHEKRLAKVKNGEPSQATAKLPMSPIKSPKYRPLVDSDPMPNPRHGGVLVPIYSDEPVPQNSEESQPFWGGILAEVGASARSYQVSLARSPQMIISSDAFHENNGSGSLAVQGQDENDWSQEGALDEPQISPRSPDIIPLSPDSNPESLTSTSTQIQSQRTAVSLPARYPDEDSGGLQLSGSSDEELDPDFVARNITPIQSARSMEERGINSHDSRINQMDVDGSSDAGPNLHHCRSTSSLRDPEPGLVGMPFGAQARKAELAASRSAYANSSSIHSSGPTSDFSSPNRALQDEYSPQHSSQHLRTRSGGLPRSRLYISEVVASSSPEKRQRSTIGSDHPVPSDEISSVPARVRKRYKRQESSSFVASEASNDPASPTQSAYATENPFGGPPRSSPPEPMPHDLDYLPSSPRSIQTRNHDSPSVYLNSMSARSHNNSSYSDLTSYDYSLLPRQPFHPLPTPTIPTAHTSFNDVPLPFNPAPVDENVSYIRHPYAPSTPPSRSSSITLHPTHISIYNDSLPSYSQPQTPIGLPRNGLPRMSLHNPYHTAPARPGGGPGPRRGPMVWNSDVFTTPTRAERRRGVGFIGDGRPLGRNDDQENVSVEVEAERREMREQGRRGGPHWTGGSLRGWRISEWEP
ncbi:MAG: hypothetical protein Q9171_005969 [Xanthocarpia ochracea]